MPRRPLAGQPGISSEDHLRIINECGAVVRPLLQKLGWAPDRVSPLAREARSMRDVAAATEAVFKIAKVAADPEVDEDCSVVPPQPHQVASMAKGRAPAASLAKAVNVFQSMANELTDPSDISCDEFLEKHAGEAASEADCDAQHEPDPHVGIGVGSSVVALLKELPRLAPEAMLIQLTKVCADIGKVANGSRHKGRANKRTILEKLMEKTARVGGDGQHF